MRIQQNIKSNLTRDKNLRVQADQQSQFQDVMQHSQGRQHQESMSKLVKQVREKGALLVEERTVKRLSEYRKIVKIMLQEVVNNGLKLSQTQGSWRKRKTKSYQIVEQIDRELIELTDDLLQEEEARLKLLAIVGEIEGLMVHFYS